MAAHQFQPGIRFSGLDLAILVGGAVATVTTLTVVPWLAFVIAFVVAHFFLFCNVFRIARALELVWAALFVGLVTGTVSADFPGWTIAVGLSLAATVAVIILEMRMPSYHGIFWRQINPGLRQWWEQNVASAESAA